MSILRVLFLVAADHISFFFLFLRPWGCLTAENLFLRKQLAFFQERKIWPRRIDLATKLSLVLLSKLFNWKEALVIVKPPTLIRWHREAFRLFWRWKSKPGRPSIPPDLRVLIRQIARENPLWGEERIADELLLKLGIQVSPRTVRKYMRKSPSAGPRGDQRWSTFLKNHAGAILACDFFVAVTVTFRVFYVFVVLEHGSRRILHCNVTTHPTSEWTQQQLRQAISSDHGYRFLIHDGSGIFSQEFDDTAENMGLRVIKTPYRSPQANSICERTIGTVRRECLDHLIPLTGNHLRRVLKEWVSHYNRGRPHSVLGPGIPDPPEGLPVRLDPSQVPDRRSLECRIRAGLGRAASRVPAGSTCGLRPFRIIAEHRGPRSP